MVITEASIPILTFLHLVLCKVYTVAAWEKLDLHCFSILNWDSLVPFQYGTPKKNVGERKV